MTLSLKVFVEEGGKAPQKGKEGDAGLDCFACLPNHFRQIDFGNGMGDENGITVPQFGVAKIPLGFRYAFWVDGQVSHDFWLDIRNRSGVGTNSGFVTLAEVGDANYRGVIHYCVAKVTPGSYTVLHGAKIAQALITPFVDPHRVTIEVVNSIEALGASSRGDAGFGRSGL